jgi:hypothetical protein
MVQASHRPDEGILGQIRAQFRVAAMVPHEGEQLRREPFQLGQEVAVSGGRPGVSGGHRHELGHRGLLTGLDGPDCPR